MPVCQCVFDVHQQQFGRYSIVLRVDDPLLEDGDVVGLPSHFPHSLRSDTLGGIETRELFVGPVAYLQIFIQKIAYQVFCIVLLSTRCEKECCQ